MKTTKIVLSINGMHCASCATLINRKLSRIPGVSSANVNYSAGKATVDFDEKQAGEKQILETVKSLGYGAAVGADYEREKAMREAEISHLKRLTILSAAFSIPAVALGMFLMEFPYRLWLLFLLSTPVQFYIGRGFYQGAYAALRNGTASMDTLIAVGTSAAYFYSLAALAGLVMEQYFEVSASLITLVLLGKYLEAAAKGRASSAIRKLLDLSPKKATVLRGKTEVEIPASELAAGDIAIVKPGSRVPADGMVIWGDSSVDESMITGESMPVEKRKGASVTGGTINKLGAFRFRVTRAGSESTLAQIVKLVEEAQGSKAPIQRFADSVSAVFVPVVVGIAIITFASWYFVFNATIGFAVLTAVAVLVIACPCALGLATPTAIMVGTGMGAQRGILFKDAQSLEKMHSINTVVFDKTGTITQGKPTVTDVLPFDASEKEVLSLAASIEKQSEHPLAEAVVGEAQKRKLAFKQVAGFKAISGKGITGTISGRKLALGSPTFAKEHSKPTASQMREIGALESMGKTVMLLLEGKKILGAIAVADPIKPTSQEAVRRLGKMGIACWMITGDNERTARAIAKQAGIANVFAHVLPQDKASYVKKLQGKGGVVAMVGDGVNDAPALAASDVGIAIGSGTDVAIETGSVVLMKSDLMDAVRAIRLGRATIGKIKQNMFWALAYNVLGIPIAAGVLYPFTGMLLSPIIAGAAMALSSVSVVTNSVLLRRAKID
ncbi:MAG: heavy metal translocating P-type ATPase [Candidatus Micrarchaeia archaeon]